MNNLFKKTWEWILSFFSGAGIFIGIILAVVIGLPIALLYGLIGPFVGLVKLIRGDLHDSKYSAVSAGDWVQLIGTALAVLVLIGIGVFAIFLS